MLCLIKRASMPHRHALLAQAQSKLEETPRRTQRPGRRHLNPPVEPQCQSAQPNFCSSQEVNPRSSRFRGRRWLLGSVSGIRRAARGGPLAAGELDRVSPDRIRFRHDPSKRRTVIQPALGSEAVVSDLFSAVDLDVTLEEIRKAVAEPR